MKFQVLILLIVFGVNGFGQTSKKYNVLFIISDDLTATALSCYGNTICKTPNIDGLASEGVKYSRAYCQYPVCGPSRASMLFGYYPHASKAFGSESGREKIGNDKYSLPQLFKENGYYTARVSKIFHMGRSTENPKVTPLVDGTNGQDDVDSWTERFNCPGPEWFSEGEFELLQENPYSLEPEVFLNKIINVKADGGDEIQSDGKVAKKASELLRTHGSKPFFLAVGFIRPHVPFVAPKSYFDKYPYEMMPLPPQVMNDWDDIPSKGINYVTSVNGEMSQEQEKKSIAGYYASVSFLDDQVGKVLKTLKEEGLEDNTIVIFTSDHGFHLGEHRFWMKVGLHEESARVPLIIKVPGKEPLMCNSFVELIDLYPTLADLSGLELEQHVQGKSLKNTLDDPNYKLRDFAFTETQGGETFLIRTDKWAYIQYNIGDKIEMELYDMELDPQQFTNLGNNPLYKGIVKDMQSKLNKKLQEISNNDL